jgi:hypothetical protein
MSDGGGLMGRALAIAVALVLLLPACASAWSLGEDMAVAQSLLPGDHPCRTGSVDVRSVPGLRSSDGELAIAAAPFGRRTTNGWMMQTTSGWAPLECWVQIELSRYAQLTACDRRRTMIHEVAGHLAGHIHSEGGVMSANWQDREGVAVPGCRGASLTARVTDRVLGLVPVGWGVSCGRRGPVVSCRADRGSRVRRYRARVVGDGFTLRRVRT